MNFVQVFIGVYLLNGDSPTLIWTRKAYSKIPSNSGVSHTQRKEVRTDQGASAHPAADYVRIATTAGTTTVSSDRQSEGNPDRKFTSTDVLSRGKGILSGNTD